MHAHTHTHVHTRYCTSPLLYTPVFLHNKFIAAVLDTAWNSPLPANFQQYIPSPKPQPKLETLHELQPTLKRKRGKGRTNPIVPEPRRPTKVVTGLSVLTSNEIGMTHLFTLAITLSCTRSAKGAD